MENLDSNIDPIKVVTVKDADFYANVHPYKVKIVGGGGAGFEIKVVDELPETGEAGVMYMVPSGGEHPNVYDEYLYVDGNWEIVGNTAVDLTDYVKRTDYSTKSTAGVVRLTSTYATDMDTAEDGAIRAAVKTYTEYSNARNSMFIGKGTLENVITGKGLVSDTDYATESKGGTVKTARGVYLENGELRASSISYDDYTAKTNQYFIGKGTLENVITGKGLISSTDIATGSKAGIVMTNATSYGLQTASSGSLQAVTKTYDQYTTVSNACFVGKGTLENVIAGKGLAKKVTLYSDGDSICSDAELTTPMTFEQVKALTQDKSNIVVVHNSNYELRFEYHAEKADDDAIWFNGVTSLDGETYMYRIIINSDNEVKSDEYHVITDNDMQVLTESQYEAITPDSDVFYFIKEG